MLQSQGQTKAFQITSTKGNSHEGLQSLKQHLCRRYTTVQVLNRLFQ